jgi:hypothetical protein
MQYLYTNIILSDFNCTSRPQENPGAKEPAGQRLPIQVKTGQCHRFQVSLARSTRLSDFSHINNTRSVPGYASSIRAVVRE